jgi:hypothetical protein
MPLVVDASVSLAWALPDESSAYPRKRITSADEQAFLAALSHIMLILPRGRD